MPYKKKKTDMSRAELENRVEWLTVELKRTKESYDRLIGKYDTLYAQYLFMPKWMRRLAEKKYEGRRSYDR